MSKAKYVLKKIPLIIWVLVALVVVFSIKSNRYFTFRNLITLLQQGSVLLVVASAATFVIISGWHPYIKRYYDSPCGTKWRTHCCGIPHRWNYRNGMRGI